MKNNLLKLLLVPLLIIFVYFISAKTYSSLFSKVDANTSIDVANFKILINDINTLVNKEITIGDINWRGEHTNDNVIAPGSEGTFSFIIDPSSSQVAITYEIKFIDHIIDENKILTVTNVVVDGENKILDNNILNGIFYLNDIESQKTNKVDVTVKWINDENNNESDSLIGLQQVEAQFIDIEFNATQYKG